MKIIYQMRQYFAQGFHERAKTIEREKVANNTLKMSGMPMRRKKNRKDKRGQIRKGLIKWRGF